MRAPPYDVIQRIALINDLFRYRALMDVVRWLETRKAKLMKQTLRSVGPPTMEELVPPDQMDPSQERFVARLIYALLLIMGFTVVVLLDTPFGRGELPQYNYVWGTFILSIVFYIATVTSGPGIIVPPSLSPPSLRNSSLHTNTHPAAVSSSLTTQLCFTWFAHVDCLTQTPPEDFFLPGVLDATSFSSFSAGTSKNDDCCDASPLAVLTVSVPQIPMHERFLARPIFPAEGTGTTTTTTTATTTTTTTATATTTVTVTGASSKTTFTPTSTATSTSASTFTSPLSSSLWCSPASTSLPSSAHQPLSLRPSPPSYPPPPSSLSSPSPPSLLPLSSSSSSSSSSRSPPSPLLSSLSLLCPSLPLPLLLHLSRRIHTLLSSFPSSSSPSPPPSSLSSLSPLSSSLSLSLPPVSSALLSPTFCLTCMHTRPHRAKHCRQCGACIARHDHHCPFLATCVGAGNHVYFALFLFLTVATLLTALILNYYAMPTLPCTSTVSFYFITVTIPSFAEDAQCTHISSPSSLSSLSSLSTSTSTSSSLSSSSLSTPVLSPEAMWSLLFFFQCLFIILTTLLLPLAATHAAMLLADATTHQLLGGGRDGGAAGEEGNGRDEVQVRVGVGVGVGVGVNTVMSEGDGSVDTGERDAEADDGTGMLVHMPLLRHGGTRTHAHTLFLPPLVDERGREAETEEDAAEDGGKNTKIFRKVSPMSCFPRKRRLGMVSTGVCHALSGAAVAARRGSAYALRAVCGHALSVMRNAFDASTCYRHRRELWTPIPAPEPVTASGSDSASVFKSESGSGSLLRYAGASNTTDDPSSVHAGVGSGTGVDVGAVGEDEHAVSPVDGRVIARDGDVVIREFWRLVEWSIQNKDALQC